MKRLNYLELQEMSGGRFWDGVCTGFGAGFTILTLIGISAGPLGAALFTSVGAGCAIHSITQNILGR